MKAFFIQPFTVFLPLFSSLYPFAKIVRKKDSLKMIKIFNFQTLERQKGLGDWKVEKIEG